MLAIRGVYNGKTLGALPSEPLPRVQREVPVAIVFLEEVSPEIDKHQRQVEVASTCVPPAMPCCRWV